MDLDAQSPEDPHHLGGVLSVQILDLHSPRATNTHSTRSEFTADFFAGRVDGSRASAT